MVERSHGEPENVQRTKQPNVRVCAVRIRRIQKASLGNCAVRRLPETQEGRLVHELMATAITQEELDQEYVEV